MSNHGRWSRLDEAIDVAVRDLMHREPESGFRMRLFRRMDPAPRRRAWLTPALASACVALAALLLLVLVGRAPQSRAPEPTVARTVATPAAQPEPEPAPPPAVASAPAARSAAPASSPRPGRDPRRQPVAAESIFGPPRATVSAATLSTVEPSEAASEPARRAAGDPQWPLGIAPLPDLQAITVRPIEIRQIGGPSPAPPRKQ